MIYRRHSRPIWFAISFGQVGAYGRADLHNATRPHVADRFCRMAALRTYKDTCTKRILKHVAANCDHGVCATRLVTFR
jgi:hypothetical protein